MPPINSERWLARARGIRITHALPDRPEEPVIIPGQDPQPASPPIETPPPSPPNEIPAGSPIEAPVIAPAPGETGQPVDASGSLQIRRNQVRGAGR